MSLVASLLVTTLADPELPKLTPFLEIILPEIGDRPRTFRGPIPVVPTHVFIDDSTNSLVVLYDPDGLSVYDLPSGKLRQTYALARPHSFRVEFQDSILTFLDGPLRTFNLKTELEDYEPEPAALPLDARLLATHPNYGYLILKKTQNAHLYTPDRMIEVEKSKDSPNFDYAGKFDFVIREYPSLKEISRAPLPHVTSLVDTVITPDRKIIGIQSYYQSATILYRISDFKRVGKFRSAEGEITFDPQAKWATAVSRHHGLSLVGEWPTLTRIKDAQQFRLDYEIEGGVKQASSGAVSSKLGIAAIAGKYRTIHLYRLPK